MWQIRRQLRRTSPSNRITPSKPLRFCYSASCGYYFGFTVKLKSVAYSRSVSLKSEMEAVRVITRVRPPSQRDIDMESKIVANVDKDRVEVMIASSTKESEVRTFAYDGVYGPDDSTETIFKENIVELIDGALNGYNCTVFAYGQTGSGKSYTMHGGERRGTEGVVFRAIDYIFHQIDNQPDGYRSLVYCTFLEIYMEEFKDLLKPQSSRRTPELCRPKVLAIHEGKDKAVYVEGLSSITVQNSKECRRYLEKGLRVRQQATTKMNADSSRSHAIFTITVEVSKHLEGRDQITMAKLNFVDLAGSERQTKTESGKDRQNEAIQINLSLSTLGRVIHALADGKSLHIPYRDSKLTRLLETSLGGNARTVMISCISPASDNREESLSTLTYASRAKSIKNKPVINTDPQTALIRQYLDQIRRLEEQIANSPVNDQDKPSEITRIQEELRETHKKEIDRLELEQEETFRKFEAQIKQATEEEKRSLIKEKDDELRRIHDELMQHGKEEFRRVEMQKAEELRVMEEKFRKAVEDEKRRIEMENAVEMEKFRGDVERKMAQEKGILEKQQMDVLMVEQQKLQHRLQEEQDQRVLEEKIRLENEYLEKSVEQRRRLEEIAKRDVEALRGQFEAEREAEIARLQEQRVVDLKKVSEERNMDFQQILDDLRRTHEDDLQRIKRQHSEIIAKLEEEKARHEKCLEDNHKMELESEAVRLEDAIRQHEDASRCSIREHQEEILKSENVKDIALQSMERKFEGRIHELKKQHAHEVARRQEDFDNLRKIHTDELRNREIARTRENDLNLQQIKQSLERESSQKMQQKDREYRRSVQDCQKSCKQKIFDMEAENESLLESIRHEYDRECTEFKQQNKRLVGDMKKLQEDLSKLLTEKNGLASVMDELQQEHVGCKDLLEDQQQKTREFEAEMDGMKELLETANANAEELAYHNSSLRKELEKIKRVDFHSSVTKNLDGPSPRKSRRSELRSELDRFNSVRSIHANSVSGMSERSRRSIKGIEEPRPLSSARREALIQAVAGMNAESLLHTAHQEYEEQLNHCVQELDDRNNQLEDLRNQLDSTRKASLREVEDARQQTIQQSQLSQLYQQIIRQISPHLPECNYWDLQNIVTKAVWNDGVSKWQLPPVEIGEYCIETDHSRRSASRGPKVSGRNSQASVGVPDQRSVSSVRSFTPFDFDPCPALDIPQPLSTNRHKVVSARTRNNPLVPLHGGKRF